MISRFLYLSAVLSAVCCNALFYASEAPASLLLWIGVSKDGTKGRYIQEDFKTGQLKWHTGTIKIVGDKRFHECNGYIYMPLKPEDNSMGLILQSRIMSDESGIEPEMASVDRNDILYSIAKAGKTHYLERENHKDWFEAKAKKEPSTYRDHSVPNRPNNS